MMQAYIVASGQRIAPFGDPVGALTVGGVPLLEWQKGVLVHLGFRVDCVDTLEAIPNDDAPKLVTWDYVFFTRRTVASFLAAWRGRGCKRAAQVGLPLASTFVQRFSALQDFRRTDDAALFDVVLLPRGRDTTGAEPLVVPYRERLITFFVARRSASLDANTWTHPVTSSICFHVRHWLHLLQVNLLSIQVRWIDHVLSHPVWSLARALRGLLGVRGALGTRMMRAFCRIERGASIHPTALVEGSFVARGARIGPRAMVIGSIVNEGAVIDQGADVTFSVLGARSFVSKHSIVYATAALEEAELCVKGMQMCMVGRRAALTARATIMDTAGGRAIRVQSGDRFCEVDVPVLGVCAGHDVFLGPDVIVAAGREIPNGVHILADPARVMTRWTAPVVSGGRYIVKNGTLVPINEHDGG